MKYKNLAKNLVCRLRKQIKSHNKQFGFPLLVGKCLVVRKTFAEMMAEEFDKSISESFHILIEIMQKHQEWMENKNYEHHIKCLQNIRIQNRTKFVKSALPNRSARRNINMHKQSALEKTTELSHSNRNSHQFRQSEFKEPENRKSERSKEGNDAKNYKSTFLSLKEKELLWDNYLLGKRILQTNSVISMRKNEADYKKYKKILDARTERMRKQKINDEFRSSKLQEYAQATYRIAQSGRLPSSTASRQIMCLKIKQLRLRKKVFAYEDLVLKFHVMSFKDRNKKLCCQNSDIVSIYSLENHCFFFKLPAHHFKRIRNKQNSESEGHLVFSIFEVKGLNQQKIGQFAINQEEVVHERHEKRCGLQKNGRSLGEIRVQFECVSKRTLVHNLE